MTGYSSLPCSGWDVPVWSCPMPTGSEAISGVAVQVAAHILYAATAHQFGLCSVTFRPCRRECDNGPLMGGNWWEWTGQTWPQPLNYNGSWFNLTCGGGCLGTCSCTSVSEVWFPSPVYQITQVKIDGVVLNPSTYRLDDFRKLVRLGAAWPICNDLNFADTEVNTWSVTLTIGQPLPPLGQVALGELAVELAKGMLCDSSCKLPRAVQSLNRQGVNMVFVDPLQYLSNGLLGLTLTDYFIQTVNPSKLHSQSAVYDVDNMGHRIVGT